IEEDIRKVSHELNTDFVSGAGFIDILRTLVETQTAIYKLNYTFNHDGSSINWDNVPNKTKIHIYRIVQETLHNIHKHANATMVKISFKFISNVIQLSIKDNRTAFNTNRLKSGNGLKNMNTKIKEMNGQHNIVPTKKKGTTVKINIPTNYLTAKYNQVT